MKPNFFYNFRESLYEAEAPIEQESDLDKVIKRSPKVLATLVELLTSQKKVGDKAIKELRDVVGDIKMISFKPTTFRVIFKNSNYFDLIYDPTPIEMKNQDEFEPADFFRVAVAGKRYDLSNNSSFEQALDYINTALKYNPIDSNNPDEQQADTSNTQDSEPADLPKSTDKPEK